MTHKRYSVIGLGGTFDHFHDGHKHFLRYAADLGETVLVGITKARLSHHKPFADAIENYRERHQEVANFCGQEKIPVKIVPLTDEYGPTLDGSTVRALCVTPETSAGADKINTVREKLGMRPLPVFISNYALAENGQPIHSAFIREGIMNREGKIYADVLKGDLELTPKQRSFFSQPQGPVVETIYDDPLFTAVVGDKCLESFVKNGWDYDLGVFDQKTQRETYSSELLAGLRPGLKVANPAGVLTAELSQSLQKCLAQHVQHLQVDGEEDLATLALVLLLPLRASIYYGQKDQGMIHLEITEDLKEAFREELGGK